jgi:hypothetical protein
MKKLRGNEPTSAPYETCQGEVIQQKEKENMHEMQEHINYAKNLY